MAATLVGHNGTLHDRPAPHRPRRARAAFAAVAGHAVDPVVRPSDRADAQANGALALAKELGRSPREVAEAVLGALDGTMDDVAALEVAGPGFLNITFSDEFLARKLRRGRRRPARRPGATHPETVVVDYSAPQRRQGDARRPPADHDHRRRAGPHAAVRRPHVIRENHIGDWGTPFGMLIEHLVDLGEDEAATSCRSATSTASTRAARAQVRRRRRVPGAGPRRVVAAAERRPRDAAAVAAAGRRRARYFNAVYDGSASCSPTTT